LWSHDDGDSSWHGIGIGRPPDGMTSTKSNDGHGRRCIHISSNDAEVMARELNTIKSKKAIFLSSGLLGTLVVGMLLVLSGVAPASQASSAPLGQAADQNGGSVAVQHLLPAIFAHAPVAAISGSPVAATTFNWAGYAVAGATNSVTFVKGSWHVPAVKGAVCSATSFDASSTWVGIDGLLSTTVEQIGTASQCFEGALQYYAWYEFYPAPLTVISTVPVSPGDSIQANVKYSGGAFTLFINDTTTGNSFTSAATTVAGADRSSAEWITEAPAGSIGVLPLAHFATVKFTGTSATISGHTGNIGSFESISGTTVYALTMVDYPASTPTKASVSVLTQGSTVTVTGVAAGPYG